MSTQATTKAWLESATGIRYEVPAGAGPTVNVGRSTGAATDATQVSIPQGEQTKYVSRKHATLLRGYDGSWQIADAGSTSGLWVNGQKAEGEKKFPLQDGTKIRLGNYELTFHVSSDAGGGGEDGGTMIMPNFVPGAPESAEATVEKYYLDALVGGQGIEIELPSRPGVTQWTVGRAIKADGNDASLEHAIVPNLPEFTTVSRRHIQLMRADGGWTVKNLSSQGALLNGEPLGDTPSPIRPGDRLEMGNRVFILREGALRPQYNPDDFSAKAAAVATAGPGIDEKDLEDTLKLPANYSRMRAEEKAGEAWGQIVENKLIGPRSFPLSKRRTRIGSHPLNADIKLDDPGIADLHATIEWHGRDCKVHSKVQNSPVRVNHAAYRVSPPLKSGAVLTLGNQEFHIDITGVPPEATSSLVWDRARRLLIFFLFSVIIVVGSVLVGAKFVTPPVKSYNPPEEITAAQVIQETLTSGGFANLSLLRTMKLTDEESAIVAQMEKLATVQRDVAKTPDREFRRQVATIEKSLAEGRQVFVAAGLGPELGDQGWYKQLATDFHNRRGAAYSSEWEVLLQALRDNNLPNAGVKLAAMTNTQKELLDQASKAIAAWEQINREVTSRNQQAILDGYMNNVSAGRAAQFIQQQRDQLTSLGTMFEAIEKDPNEANEALMASNNWPVFKAKMEMLYNTMAALDAYQNGSLGDFDQGYTKLPAENQTQLLKTFRNNLAQWSQWQGQLAGSGDPGRDSALINGLVQMRNQFIQSQDPKSPVLTTINTKLSSMSNARMTQATSLRREAGQMPEGFDRLNKLLDAYRYDPSKSAVQEIDQLAARMVGQIQKDKTTAQNAENLRRAQKRMLDYVSDGSMQAVDISSVRQIDNLLKQP